MCGGIAVKRNGHYANGRQRWYCSGCQKSYSWHNHQVKECNQNIWFTRWITEGYSVRQLSDLSGHSLSTLKRIIQRNLHTWSPVSQHGLTGSRYLIFDGTFLHRPVSIVALMNAASNTIVAGSYGISENSMRQLSAFFQPLKQSGLAPISCTIDGNPVVFKILKELWPNIIIQRCIVHIQRQGLSWCRRIPKRTDAKHLRQIFMQSAYIDDKQQKEQFMHRVERWENRFGIRIATLPEKGKVFSDLKRARSMLLKAIPNMFHYLDDPNIPKSSNALEGYYSRLKQQYRLHRGLSKYKLHQYFNWYFYMKPK